MNAQNLLATQYAGAGLSSDSVVVGLTSNTENEGDCDCACGCAGGGNCSA